jgi:hypothetical protein
MRKNFGLPGMLELQKLISQPADAWGFGVAILSIGNLFQEERKMRNS